MRKTAYLLLSVASIAIISVLFYNFTGKKQPGAKNKLSLTLSEEEEEKEEGGIKRRLYEWKLLHDPATGQIPKGIYQKEREILSSVIKRQSTANFRPSILNNYIAAGPTQNGGRTRAVAFDVRANQVVLAAGISGGIFRSTNGGSTWTFVHPDTSVLRNVSCFAQDPRPGFQDTWYAGTGEILGASAAYSAPPFGVASGNGILKSTNNGLTWTKINFTAGTDYKELFDNIFDMIFNIQVDNRGYVYVATMNYILVSTDGFVAPSGSNFGYVLRIANTSQVPEAMATDIVISKDGSRYYACFSGKNNNRDTVGVWASTNGISDWKRIAGGRNGQPDSVAGWKAYNPSLTSGTGWGRTVLAVAPNDANTLYVMYENSLSAASNQSEADLFQANLANFNAITWSSNRAANLKATQNASTTKYLETQEGYNMLLAVHPTDKNIVLAGGVNLFKSTEGFATQQGTFIGGLVSTTYTDPNQFSHVDFHSFAFDPSNANRFVVGNDGGLQVCNNITSTPVSWDNLNNQYQTFQYYHVAIDPAVGSLTFSGGAQDNSTSYRDSKGLSGPFLPDPNDHYVGILGGDGGMTALSASTATQQFLYASAQNGIMARFDLGGPTADIQIDPSAAPEGEFVTYYHLDQDNTELLYYVADDRIWRTSNASTVTPTSNLWAEMTGVGTTLTGNIFSLATSRGAYNNASSYLFVGTENAKIYRIQDPKNVALATVPVDITPSGITANSLVREIAVNPRNPDTVLAVISNYNAVSAFWTGNALSASPTWQAVEGSKINLASFRSCAIVATSTGVEYYVGTSIGLFSTTTINSTSTNWQLEGPAMMQGAIVNDLVLRTADNTLLVGTHGNGMFYTVIGNVPTSVPDVVVNDKRFINSVFPTIATTGSINFRTGGATGIKTINIRVSNMSGQVLMQRTQGYQNGTLQLGPLSTGSYLLEIISDDRRYKHVQQFVKTY
jgi:hypothetical protein